jgi:4-hydroxy-tetrahydrodipicolinate synthase
VGIAMPDASAHRIQGILVPNIVPYDAAGRINEDELRRYAAWLIGQGIDGFFPNGSTGEFTRLTPEERLRVVEILVEVSGGRVPVVPCVGEHDSRATIRACSRCLELGARAVALVPPTYFRLADDGVAAYMHAVAAQVPGDVLLYNIPAFASPITNRVVLELVAAHSNIIGIKDSSGDVAGVSRLMAAVRPLRPSFCFLTGADMLLLPMLAMGCDGGIDAGAGVQPALTRRLYDLVRGGRQEEALVVQQRITAAFDLMFDSVQFPEGFRQGVAARGFRVGQGRHDLTLAQVAAAESVRVRIAELVGPA